ncbi:ribonuclease H [Striga asiatica]|uniref:Ribonuclease H n=1 Tax=Striga asiatica TaxID=4170 RepID=A0A5A7QCY6_STRAF|nr:ribonuclease H [Striga asiatica]
MSIESSNSSRRTSSGPKVTCRHDEEAVLLTSKTEHNPARRFYRCSPQNKKLEMKVKEMDLFKIENNELEKKLKDACEKGRKEKKLLLFLCVLVLVCGWLMMA